MNLFGEAQKSCIGGRLFSLVLSAVGFAAVLTSCGLVHDAHAARYVKQCDNRDRGEWKFGAAPSGCDAALFGSVDRIKFIYKDLLFDRNSADDAHRTWYVTNVHAVIRDLATLYIKKREPSYSKAQVEAWVHAIMTIGNQESYLSHYRIGPDGNYKLMTGDSEDSHGLMQVNQRYHASKDQDNSFDLIGNLLYGMDHYYLEFKRAQKTHCVKELSGADRWEAGVRAAYSSYNGGPGAVCRWTKPGSAWAKNDKGFYGHFKDAEWKVFVSDFAATAPIDVACLAEGREFCARAQADRLVPEKDRPIIFDDGLICLHSDKNELLCASDERTFQCLENLKPHALEATPVKMKERDKNMRMRIVKNRDTLCARLTPELVRVGGFIRLKDDVRIRATVQGEVVGLARTGSIYQVLDYEIRRFEKNERYYRVRFDDKSEGFIYGGNELDHKEWIEEAQPNSSTGIYIPRPGSMIEVVRKNGILLLQEPKERAKSLATISQGEVLRVEATLTQEGNNELYLVVKNKGKVGYLYIGRTYPTVDVEKWVRVAK